MFSPCTQVISYGVRINKSCEESCKNQNKGLYVKKYKYIIYEKKSHVKIYESCKESHGKHKRIHAKINAACKEPHAVNKA